MGVIIEFLMGHKSLAVMAIMAIALAGSGVYIKFLKNQKEELIAEKDQLKTLLDESQMNVVSLKNDIQVQNEKVEKFLKDADERQAANQVLIKKATDQAAVLKKKSDDLLKRQPPPNKPLCDAANDLINEVIQNAKK